MHCVFTHFQVLSPSVCTVSGNFGEDLSTLLRLAGQDAPERVHAAPLVQTDKLEMLVFAPDTGVEPVLYAADPQNAPAPEPIWKAARDVSIGISWNVEGMISTSVRRRRRR